MTDGPAEHAVPRGPTPGQPAKTEPGGAGDTPRRSASTAPVIPPPVDAPPALPPRASLSPADRVVPTWTDPTAARASELIGGPLGRHASVGRNRVVTPLRVVLVFALVALIVGWLAKSPCIQTGADGELDQGGQRPWITGCYNDVVPLYGSRGLDDASRDPYAFAWVDNGPDQPTGRVYPRADVREDGTSWVYDTSEASIAVSTDDLIYDASHGYSRVVDGELTAVDVVGGATTSANAPAGSPTIRYLEYPVLTGYFMWGAAALTSGYLHFADATGLLPTPLGVGAYFTITAILLALFYLWAVASTARIARRRIWDVAMMGLAPLLMVHAFTNWDLLAVGLTAGAMAAWSRQRPAGPDTGNTPGAPGRSAPPILRPALRPPQGLREQGVGFAILAGVLIGLGTAAKLYPALLLGPLLVLCLRAGAMRRFLCTLGGAVVAWLAVNLPVMLSYPQAWREFFAVNSSRGPEWDSWYFLSTVILPTDRLWSDEAGRARALLNVGSLVLFLIACAAIGWLALAASRRPRFAQLAFLVVVAFLLTNKVFSPQYALWLLPLAVLAVPRWRPVIVWQLSEVAVWFLLMLSFDTDTGKNLSIHPFAVAAVIRGAMLVMLVVMVVKDILRPERDKVRVVINTATGRIADDDPSGGVLDGAVDRLTLPTLPEVWAQLRSGRRGRALAGDGD